MKKLPTFDQVRDSRLGDFPLMFFVVCWWDLARFITIAIAMIWPLTFVAVVALVAFDGTASVQDTMNGIVAASLGIAILFSPGVAAILMMKWYEKRKAAR